MEYTCCEYIHNALAFYPDKIVACRDKENAPVLLKPDKKISLVELENNRLNIIERFKNGDIPKECEKCYGLQNKEWNENVFPIKYLRIEHSKICNLKCIYCDNSKNQDNYCGDKIKPTKYQITPLLKELFKKNKFANLDVYISGGEPTCIKEIDDILKLFIKYPVDAIFLMSSGIRYNKFINELLKQEKITLEIASDAGSKELYNQIKGVNAFDKHIEVLKKYVNTVKNNTPYRVINKYVLIEGINDSVNEIENWLINAKRAVSWTVKLDVDNRNIYQKKEIIKEKYKNLFDYYNRRTNELWMERVESWTVKELFPDFL